MADPRLNSLHLEPARRQDYRRARDGLLRACGSLTIGAARDSSSRLFDHTAIHHKGGTKIDREITCWLSDGEFLHPLQIGVNTLGRSNDNDVVLQDAYASRRHCAILIHSDETCELHDTASKNGTCVNGARVAGPTLLKCGDEIRISNQQFIFLTNGGSPSVFPDATLKG